MGFKPLESYKLKTAFLKSRYKYNGKCRVNHNNYTAFMFLLTPFY
jgi:hypothetical protein